MLSDYVLQFQAWAQNFAAEWGYLGIFFISFIGNATIFFPLPSIFIVFFFASILNPFFLGVLSGFGSALGEFTGYIIGKGGRKLAEREDGKWLKKSEKWVKKHGIFPVLILFAATPLPDDVVGIISGLINYDLKKFFLAVLIGKIILNLVVAYAGFYGIGWILKFFEISA
jgi:membrane protein YqaA with SNARE-associated domain